MNGKCKYTSLIGSTTSCIINFKQVGTDIELFYPNGRVGVIELKNFKRKFTVV